jgi:xanthine dehydrogenase accessory factor
MHLADKFKKEPPMTENRPAVLKEMSIPVKDLVIAVKGAGEMATGIACRLFRANLTHVIMLETDHPMAVRRKVCFCEAVYDSAACVEGIHAQRISRMEEIAQTWKNGAIPVLVDPEWKALKSLSPHVVIDAIIAKRNLGTRRSEAGLVIGLGPGFDAGNDVHLVIETNRGHNLGRIIEKGLPEPNTGIPGEIRGFTSERVLRAPCAGVFASDLTIGTPVKKADVIGHVDATPVFCQIDGVLRGLIRNHTRVTEKLKIGDIDPRGNPAFCTTISEKARAIGGSVLEAILRTYNH